LTLVTVDPVEVKGELKLYSCPKYLCQQVEWAVYEIIKTKFELKWTIQNIAPSTLSTNLVWKGPISLGPKIVSVLSKWPKIRLEIIQENTEKNFAERYCLSPNLGIFRAEMNSLGETVINESRLKAALQRSRMEEEPFEVELAFLLGTPWDEDLEPFRKSHQNTSVKWISKTG
jgi:hypothetical protein